MQTNAAGGDAPLFPARDLRVTPTCPRCGAQTEVERPLVADWRDRRRLLELLEGFPHLPCPSCGASIPAPAPALVLRPGDPIPVLFCVPPDAMTHLGAFEDALAAFATTEGGVIEGPIANTSAELLRVVADKYSGFAITGVPCPGQDWIVGAREWVTAMRSLHEWPDVTTAVNRFIVSDPYRSDYDLFCQERSLQDRAWDPVVRRIGTLTVETQTDQGAADQVRQRMRTLAGYRLTGADFDPSAPDTVKAAGLLAELLQLQASPNRSSRDVTRGIDVGRALIAHSTTSFGDTHPLVLTAMNDTAALLLDDATTPERSRREALELLNILRSDAARLDLRSLADATTNYALALLPRTTIADADTAETSIELLQDAIHLHWLHSPDDVTRTVSALANLASLTRSRLAGDPDVNIADAVAMFDEAIALTNDPGRRSLSTPDRLMLGSNRVSALAERTRLQPGPGNDQAVMDAIDEIDVQLADLDSDHPVRAMTLANFGAVVLDMLARDSPALPDDAPERVVRWLTDASHATRNLAVDDSARVVATMNLAAALFRTGDAEDADTAETMLTAAGEALAAGESTRLHHTLFQNLAQLHLSRGNFVAARDTLATACAHADQVIDRAATTSTRLAQVAAAGDLFQRLAFVNAHMQDARSAIHAVERSRARWRATNRYDPDATDQAVAGHLRTGESLLYAGTCGLGTWAVILIAGGGAAAWTTTGTTEDVTIPLRELQTAAGVSEVAAALDRAATILDPLLTTASKIVAASDIHHLAVIASGPLAGLPLAALSGSEGALDTRTTVTYLTAAHTNEAAAPDTDGEADRPTGTTRTVAVINPTGDLRFADAELDAVTRYAPDVATPGPAGTRGWLLDNLRTASHLHLACHARYEPADPLASRFILGDRLALTIEDIANVRIDNTDLVVASGCQTGVVDPRAADELVGLAYALIAAGAHAVIAALWDLDDLGTSLLVAKLYDQLGTGDPPAAALRNAQHELRTLRTSELANLTRADATNSWIPAALRPELRALALHPQLRDPESRPFTHPAHWSALVYIRG